MNLSKVAVNVQSRRGDRNVGYSRTKTNMKLIFRSVILKTNWVSDTGCWLFIEDCVRHLGTGQIVDEIWNPNVRISNYGYWGTAVWIFTFLNARRSGWLKRNRNPRMNGALCHLNPTPIKPSEVVEVPEHSTTSTLSKLTTFPSYIWSNILLPQSSRNLPTRHDPHLRYPSSSW